MKVRHILLLLGPTVLGAQQTTTVAGAVSLEIRSADTTRILNVSVDVGGGLFGSLGVLPGSPGEVRCARRCTATTPAVLEFASTGEGRLVVPDNVSELEVTVVDGNSRDRRVVARGHRILFSRNERGELRLLAREIATRF